MKLGGPSKIGAMVLGPTVPISKTSLAIYVIFRGPGANKNFTNTN